MVEQIAYIDMYFPKPLEDISQLRFNFKAAIVDRWKLILGMLAFRHWLIDVGAGS